MNHRNACIADLEDIKGLLIDSNLPSDDIAEHLDNYIVYEEEGRIIGVGGLETHGVNGLVRSIAVRPENQRKGIGNLIYKLIEHEARKLGITTLFLLTETAENYFIKHGFSVKERVDIPESIMNSKQYKFLCPSTAKLMYRRLSGSNEQKKNLKKNTSRPLQSLPLLTRRLNLDVRVANEENRHSMAKFTSNRTWLCSIFTIFVIGIHRERAIGCIH